MPPWTAQHLEINTAHYEEKCQVAGTPLERERGRELPEEIMPDAQAFLASTVTELHEEQCRRVDPLYFYLFFNFYWGIVALQSTMRRNDKRQPSISERETVLCEVICLSVGPPFKTEAALYEEKCWPAGSLFQTERKPPMRRNARWPAGTLFQRDSWLGGETAKRWPPPPRQGRCPMQRNRGKSTLLF